MNTAEQVLGHIHVQSITWDKKHRVIRTGKFIIRFTPKEFLLLSTLRTGLPTSYENLSQNVCGCTYGAASRVNLDKIVDRVRHKLQGKGLYIYCVLNYGYILYPEKEYRYI